MTPIGVSNNFQKHTATKGSKDNAHVFYGRICQDTFNIHFHLCVQHTKESRDKTNYHNYNCPPVIPFRQEVKHKTTKAVQSDFQHNATHQRGNMTRSCRVSVGKPNVQGNQACLQSKANERSSKGCVEPATL